MELGGDEKRIQALFSELSVEHQITAPRFEKLWQGAVAHRPTQSRGLSALIAAAAIVIIAVFSFVVWSQYRTVESVPPQNAINVTPPTSPIVVQREQVSDKVAAVPRHVNSHRYVVKKLAPQPERERSVVTESALLSSWVSPTSTFLESPSGSMFNSLPQLNQSAEDLKSFLPKNAEAIKESNQ
ncbi:MAG TPA: hypothetical protein VF088_09575 [Pyrinomonadaceae bacterium]